MSAAVRPASFSAFWQGVLVRSTRSPTSFSSLAREILTMRCLGPFWSAVMKGRFTSVSMEEESSFLAFSPASLRRCSAMRSAERSMPFSRLNSSTRYWITALSKSSPPRKVSPLVARTSTTLSPTSRMEISKVPPPRSNTAIFSLAFLSKPYARDAAVGSLMIRFTSRPAMRPASLVA